MKFLFLFTLLLSSLFAHPHTFIEVYPTIKTKNNYIETIKYKWVLDEMTSSMLQMEFDTNGDGKIDKNENSYIYKNYFSPLNEYSFYTTIIINGKSYDVKTVKNFEANIIDNKIVYEFVVDKKMKLNNTEIEFGDKDFFVAMVMKKEFVKSDVHYKVNDVDNDFYFGYKLVFN